MNTIDSGILFDQVQGGNSAGKGCVLLKCFLLIALFLGIAQTHATEADRIVRVLDDTELIHLTNVPETNGKQRFQVIVESNSTSSTDDPVRQSKASRPLLPSLAIQKIVGQAAQKHQVEPELVYAIMGTESAFSANAVSPKGAKGLMQLMPATASRYGVTNLLDVQQNINAGTWHLRTLLDEFNGNKTLALAAYNAGSAAVLRYQKQVPPYSETQAYVPNVLRRYEALFDIKRLTQGYRSGRQVELP